MQRSETIGALAKALAEFQGSVSPIPKGKTATIPGRDGRSGYTYTYADLADVMSACAPVLAKNGLSVTNDVGCDGQTVIVTATLMHESGEWIQTDPLLLPSGSTPQTVGSAITYGRRYTTSALLGIASDADDDASAATHSADAKPNAPQMATDGQVKAIWAISKAVGFSSEHLLETLEKRFGKDAHPDKLTKAQAKQVIDGLKKLEEQKKADAAQASAEGGEQ